MTTGRRSPKGQYIGVPGDEVTATPLQIEHHPPSPRRASSAKVALFVFSALGLLLLFVYSGSGGSSVASLFAIRGDAKSSSGGGAPTGLDFAVVGFPKTGTTFLLDVLELHPEVVTPAPKGGGKGGGKREFCEIHKKDGDELTLAWLRNASSATAASRPKSGLQKKYGIKCPTMVRNANAIDNLANISDNTRLVVGVRHPVLWLQSFYNYRLWEHYAYSIDETIPGPLELTNGTNVWHDVTTAYARFDVYLRQLDKVSINPSELKEMLDNDLWPKRISHNSFKIFIYTAEQLHDKDTTRQQQFQLDLQEFLGLEAPLPNFNEVPKANVHDSTPYPEHMDICERGYRGLRNQLVRRGKQSSGWILEKFIQSPDVVVSGEDHFASILGTWGDDPCNNETARRRT